MASITLSNLNNRADCWSSGWFNPSYLPL